jgi:small-conductance mechanosensitive channel
MKASQGIVVVGALVLVAIAITAFLIIGNSLSVPGGGTQAAADKGMLVDQRPLQTARKMAALASTQEEQHIAQEVLRISDHEVDLAFADALRSATQHPAQPSPEVREINSRMNRAQAAIDAGQVQVTKLTAQLASASAREQDELQQQVELAKAQLELDQDELDDAKADLARSGGDSQNKLQRLLDEHEAAEHAGDGTHPPANPTDANYLAPNLVALVRAWNALRGKHQQLLEARQEALEAAARLNSSHEALEKQVQQQKPGSEDLKQAPDGPPSASSGGNSKARTAAAVSSLRQLSSAQKTMAGLDKRIQDQQELSENYGKWIGLVSMRQSASVHRIIQSGLGILLIVLLVYLAGRMIDRFFVDLTPERKRLATLRAVIRFVVQAVGVLLIAVVLLGLPNQTPTILGLAGAGLTVALKDFIVAFFGWFVLMGRNGIRVGDWVEINGVGGEVVEIGLLRTVLMETGNWADAGHPTGRKVAFVNSFAVEGHYFNFSTSGQWLWDEIQVLVPAGENPYPVIDGIHKLIARETQADARMAEQEWQASTGRYRLKSFSAEPAINLRPTAGGVQVHVRYITRAHERYATRTRLYHSMVELMQRKHVPVENELAAKAKNV